MTSWAIRRIVLYSGGFGLASYVGYQYVSDQKVRNCVINKQIILDYAILTPILGLRNIN